MGTLITWAICQKKILMIKTVESYGTPRNIFESPHLETVNVKKKSQFSCVSSKREAVAVCSDWEDKMLEERW